MTKKKAPLLGVIGGLGPMSTFYFCELLTAHTMATCDADHIDMIISSRASTPDRTAFILGKSSQDPLPVMQTEAKRLIAAGADLLVIPCNTAHYFYEGLSCVCSVPILNIIQETTQHLANMNVKKFGLLATEGTIKSGAYHHACRDLGIECMSPTDAEQQQITDLIYGSIKQGRPANLDALWQVAHALCQRGCERLVLGCTELSLLKKHGLSDALFVDSLEVLAYRTIRVCQRSPIGFPNSFSDSERR